MTGCLGGFLFIAAGENNIYKTGKGWIKKRFSEFDFFFIKTVIVMV